MGSSILSNNRKNSNSAVLKFRTKSEITVVDVDVEPQIGFIKKRRGKQRIKKSGEKEPFTILSSSHKKKGFLKVLVPNRNPVEELYRLFPQLSPGEKPVNGFTCALHKDILLQGKMIICTNCICFHSNIFGYETRVIIYLKNIIAIRREKTAFVVPNAISIRTLHKRYFFCSFLSRESVFKLISQIWNTPTDVNMGIEGKDEEDTKIHKKDFKYIQKIDYNHNRLLFTSSSSYESSVVGSYSRAYELPERPHTSPPSLHNDSPDLSNSQRKQLQVKDNIFNHAHTDDDVLKTSKHFRPFLLKSNTLNDLRELSSVEHKIGSINVNKIGKQMLRRHQESMNIGETPVQKAYLSFVVFISYITSAFLHIFHRVRLKHPALTAISILVLLLAIISFILLVRINKISSRISKQVPASDNINLKMKHLFQYQDDIHSAKVERMKSILSVNLETVNEVQQALRALREKLQTN